MKNKNKTNYHSRQGVTIADNLPQVFYDGKPLPEWLQHPIAEWQRKEEPEQIPDWVLQPVSF